MMRRSTWQPPHTAAGAAATPAVRAAGVGPGAPSEAPLGGWLMLAVGAA
jgi:hypothetical protein